MENLDRYFFRLVTIHVTDGWTEFSSPDRVCIPCRAGKIKYTFTNSLIYLRYLLTYEYREIFRRGITADSRQLIGVDRGCGSLIKLCVLMQINVVRSAHLC